MILRDLMDEKNLTESEQILAQYIVEHYTEVPHMTVRELAQASYVSAPTVMRLCGKLGYDSYTAFKVELSKESSDTYVRMAKIDYDVPFRRGASDQEIVKEITSLALSSIISTRDHFDYTEARKICELLKTKRFIDIYGMGNALCSAQEFCEKMGHIGYVINSIDHSDQGMTRAFSSGPEQVAFLVSYSGLNRAVLQLLRPLRQGRTKIVAITSNPNSPLLAYADCRLLVDSKESLQQDRKTDNFGALYSMHVLFDCLYAMIYADNFDENQRRSHQLSSLQPISKPTAGRKKGEKLPPGRSGPGKTK